MNLFVLGAGLAFAMALALLIGGIYYTILYNKSTMRVVRRRNAYRAMWGLYVGSALFALVGTAMLVSYMQELPTPQTEQTHAEELEAVQELPTPQTRTVPMPKHPHEQLCQDFKNSKTQLERQMDGHENKRDGAYQHLLDEYVDLLKKIHNHSCGIW